MMPEAGLPESRTETRIRQATIWTPGDGYIQGKVCEIIDQEGNSEMFRYDREGRMVFHVDRNGKQVRTTYNVDGNPVLERACDYLGENEVTRSWEYDDIGNVKKAVAGGFCYTYEYRPDGKLIKKLLYKISGA
ncbi:hypothetical protein [Enterocloster bolteae]|uniref:hypothetical protein n=1 Tax=Enterocloster bolteae TaxID=208479 RepID=UPI0028FEF3D6|nr:hypothetical protein [Enterocloster bolteae]MDU1140130.1 hypothetical protein [Enterocloster bolteae]